jgi:hypothetical protein
MGRLAGARSAVCGDAQTTGRQGGDVTGNGISKLVFTILSAVAEAERDRIRERVAAVKSDQRARDRYLGGIAPFGWCVGDDGELTEVPAQQAARPCQCAQRRRRFPRLLVHLNRATQPHVQEGGAVIGFLALGFMLAMFAACALNWHAEKRYLAAGK